MAPALRRLLLIACAAFPTTAAAQMFAPDYALIGAPMSSFLSTSYLTQSVVNDLSQPGSAAAKLEAGMLSAADRPGIVVSMAGPGTSAAKLALAYPASQRAAARGVFDELLANYALIEDQFGIPRGDLAGAVAAFLAGNWMALNGADFPDSQFLPLVRQLRGVLLDQPALVGAPAGDLREMYDQMAIIGMLMAATQMGLQHSPDADVRTRMQGAAADYLRQFLGTDPQLLTFTPQGVTLR